MAKRDQGNNVVLRNFCGNLQCCFGKPGKDLWEEIGPHEESTLTPKTGPLDKICLNFLLNKKQFVECANMKNLPKFVIRCLKLTLNEKLKTFVKDEFFTDTNCFWSASFCNMEFISEWKTALSIFALLSILFLLLD